MRFHANALEHADSERARHQICMRKGIRGWRVYSLLGNAEVAHEERVIPRDLTPTRIPARTTTVTA